VVERTQKPNDYTHLTIISAPDEAGMRGRMLRLWQMQVR
jgi:hypothetical protein